MSRKKCCGNCANFRLDEDSEEEGVCIIASENACRVWVDDVSQCGVFKQKGIIDENKPS